MTDDHAEQYAAAIAEGRYALIYEVPKRQRDAVHARVRELKKLNPKEEVAG